MKKFLVQIGLFILIGLPLGEVMVRTCHLIDVPRYYKGEEGLLHFYPNQKGTFQNRERTTWEINQYGYCGEAPESLDNLIILYGDSFIENL